MKSAKNNILISGSSSGLGRHLLEAFNAKPFTRETSEREITELRKKGVETIIHAAFNSSKDISSANLYSYISDNILLTNILLEIPHKKFIYISTVDVYPIDGKKHTEEQIIDISSVYGIYAITKLISESLVKEKSKNHLILRCTTLLGKYSRGNSLIRIFKDKKPALSLSGKSSFNYILHSDVSGFINTALEKNLKGVYNLASSTNITLGETAKILRKEVKFGNYIYNVGDIDNTKAASIYPKLRQASHEVISTFIKTA